MLKINSYVASDDDLKAIEEGIRIVWNPKLDFIFKDKSKIDKTVVISYDSKNIYLWINKNLTKIPHKLKIEKDFHSWWRGGLLPNEVEKYLPDSTRNKTRLEIPIISGGLLQPFIELQKLKKRAKNPYVTRESYLATIIHEFGHVYYDQHKLWWFSNKDENLKNLMNALSVLNGNHVSKISLKIPSYQGLGEVFAFCVEYCASRFFLPKHQQNLDKFTLHLLDKLVESEKAKDLSKDNSVLDNYPYHNLAAAYGFLLLSNYPGSWFTKILRPSYI